MASESRYMKGVALVTGAASGIGREVARMFVLEGCTRVVLVDVDGDGLNIVGEELRGLDSLVRTCLIVCDVSNEADVQRMVNEGVKAFGAIHYCVNNAGITGKARLRTHETTADDFDRVQNVNLRGMWLCQREEISQMLKQGLELHSRSGTHPQRGSIVNLSSIYGRVAHEASVVYASTKTGVLGLTRGDAVAYGRDGIRVNAILPGAVKTPTLIEQGAVSEEGPQKAVPLGRWAAPAEIAEVIVFLCSEKASYISGEEILVDGGVIHKTPF